MKSWGLQNNPYDPCVINKVVDGKYCTVCSHVYDLKISHLDSTVTDNILRRLEQQYVEVSPLNDTWIKVHDYLWMVLDFRKKGKVRVTMPKHI